MSRHASVRDVAYQVKEIKVLKNQNRSDEAQKLLEKIAQQVRPIMENRKWSVGVLLEMYPKNACLLGLNVNKGRQVKIRLRKARNPDEFLPYESLLGTMLHELTHNQIGPHSAAFYKLLGELTTECENLMAKGIFGSMKTGGFIGQGSRVGGRQPVTAYASTVAGKAAIQRTGRKLIGTNGSQKLGGQIRDQETIPMHILALRAVEKRLNPNLWCNGQDVEEESDSPLSNGNKLNRPERPQNTTSPPPESRQKKQIVTTTAATKNHDKSNRSLSQKKTEVETWLCDACSFRNLMKVKNCLNCDRVDPYKIRALLVFSIEALASCSPPRSSVPPSSSSSLSHFTEPVPNWSCDYCSFVNSKPFGLSCEMCANIRKVKEKRHSCAGIDYWTCDSCTYHNSLSEKFCSICTSAKQEIPSY